MVALSSEGESVKVKIRTILTSILYGQLKPGTDKPIAKVNNSMISHINIFLRCRFYLYFFKGFGIVLIQKMK